MTLRIVPFVALAWLAGQGCGGGAAPETETAGITPVAQVAVPAGKTWPEIEPIPMVPIPAGEYLPLYGAPEARVAVEGFELDPFPVTKAAFLEFVQAAPEWRRSQVKPVFADDRYLADWVSDLDPGLEEPDDARRPVTGVSWFAARAYCEWRGARLPTLDEWELVAAATADRWSAAGDAAAQQELLEASLRPTPAELPVVGSGPANLYGVYDLHGSLREWVEDFNSVVASGESRGDGMLDRGLFCAAGASGVTDLTNHSGLLRYAFRGSLRASDALATLGFRCARGGGP